MSIEDNTCRTRNHSSTKLSMRIKVTLSHVKLFNSAQWPVLPASPLSPLPSPVFCNGRRVHKTVIKEWRESTEPTSLLTRELLLFINAAFRSLSCKTHQSNKTTQFKFRLVSIVVRASEPKMFYSHQLLARKASLGQIWWWFYKFSQLKIYQLIFCKFCSSLCFCFSKFFELNRTLTYSKIMISYFHSSL